MNRKQAFLGVLLASLCGATTVQAYELVPASQRSEQMFAPGNILGFGEDSHNVFLERVASPNPLVDRRDYLRISGISLDFYGNEFWSLAQYGEFYDSKSGAGRTIVPMTTFSNTPAGIPIVGDTFYLAWTQEAFQTAPPFDNPNRFAYGWVKLKLASPLRSESPSGASPDLILLGGGGTNFGSRGIVVGVPEPTGATLGATTVCALFRLRRRRMHA